MNYQLESDKDEYKNTEDHENLDDEVKEHVGKETS